jgi:hypothetical protein
LTDGNSFVPIPAWPTEPFTFVVGSCLFQRFRENILSFENLRSVLPYANIDFSLAIILFSLIFNPFARFLSSGFLFHQSSSTSFAPLLPVISFR